jgi:hypothetical protein
LLPSPVPRQLHKSYSFPPYSRLLNEPVEKVTFLKTASSAGSK